MIRSRLALLAAGLTLLALAPEGPAGNDNNWTNATTNLTWNLTSNNWTNSTVWSNANIDSAIFGSTGVGTITVAVPITLNGMQFSANGYTLSGSSALTLKNGGDPLLEPGECQVLSGIAATVNVPIAGTIGLDKTFPGTLILGGTNTFTGTTLLNGGTLEITGSMTNSTVLASGTTLMFAQTAGATLPNTYTGSGALVFAGTHGTVFTLSSASNSYTGGTQVQFGTLQMGAAYAIPIGSVVTLGSGTNPAVLRMAGFSQAIGGLQSSGTGAYQVTNFGGTGENLLTINPQPSHSYTYAGLLGGPATNDNNFALVVSGGGTQILTDGSNNYSGGTTINNSYLSVSDVGALGSGQLVLEGSQLSGGGAEAIATWLYTGPTVSTARATVLTNAGGAIQVSTTGTTLTMSGVISESGGTGHALTVYGDGNGGSTLILTGNNSYTGPTIVDGGGVLSIASVANGGVASPLGAASNNPANIQLGGLFGGGTLLYTGSTSSTDRGVTLYSASENATINVATTGTALTMSGQFTGPDALTKAGAGTLILGNSGNNYTGGTFVTAGTLKLGTAAANQIPSGGNVTVSSGAVFDLGTPSNTSNYNTPAGTITLNGGTLRVEGSSSTSGYTANNLVMTGGTLDFSQTTANQFYLNLRGDFTINASSTTALWNGSSSTPGAAIIVDNTNVPLTINVAAGTTSSGIDLDSSVSLFGTFIKAGPGVMRVAQQDTYDLAMTVAAGTLRVDSVTDLNNLTGSIAGNTLTLNGGTLLYGGPTTTSAANPLTLSSNSAVGVMIAGTTLTLAEAISGPGSLTKTGPGTLVLTNAGNTFTGGVTVTQGTLSVAADNLLGPTLQPVNVGPLGTLLYSASGSTARTIIMNSGALQAAAGTMLTLNGATIGGGFLSGTGTFATGAAGATFVGVTSTPSATIISNSAADQFINFSNSALFSVAAGVNTAGAFAPTNFNGFTNQGLGSVTIGAGSQLNAANFQSYGNVTLTPATINGQFTELANTGTSPLGFNGGSQTFVGTASAPNANVVGVDLGGQNLILAGALFVNNGLVYSRQSSGSVYVEYGATYKGAGTTNVPVITQNGGKVVFGNCPGVATFGGLVLGAGGIGNLEWEINDAGPSATYPHASGVAGPTSVPTVSGWSLGQVTSQTSRGSQTYGNLTWTATPANPFNLELETLVGPATQVGMTPDGLMADFDPTQSYSWPIITYQGTYSGPTSDAQLTADTLFDKSLFANAIPAGGEFGLHLDQYPSGGGELDLVYSPSAVPEPGTLALVAMAAAFGWRRLRRRSSAS